MALLQSRQQKLKQREKDLLQQSRAKTAAREAAKSASTPSGGFSYLDQGKLGQVYDTQSSADQQRAISGGAKYFEDTGTFLGTLGSSSGRGTAPASYGSASTSRTPTSRTTSEGANRGEAGRSSLGTDTVKTRFDGTDTQVDRTAGVRVDPMQQYMNMFSTSPADRMKAVRDSLSKDRRTQIDSIEKKYNEQVRDEEAAGKEDLARMRSMNLRAGLGGSDFGAANKQAVRSNTRQNIGAIEANKDIEIGGVLDTLDQLANQRFQLEEQAMQSDFSNMMAIEEYRVAQREQATEQIASLGKAGFDVATIKERDPQLYESMSAASGMGDVEMEAVINNAKATANKVDYQYKVAGNKLIAFGVDPMTGTLKMLEQEVDIPENYGITTMPDGTVLAVPDNFDGDVTKIKTIGNYAKPVVSSGDSSNGLTPYQQFSATQNLKKTTQTLTEAQRELQRQVGIMNETWSRLSRGEAKDLNGTSQAIITTFNKILDPTSVVRESEYDRTPAGQALIENISGRIASITQGGPGLTKESLKELVDLGNTFAINANQHIQQRNLAAREEAAFWGLNPDFVATAPQTVRVQSPDGAVGTIPYEDLDAAISEGYIEI